MALHSLLQRLKAMRKRREDALHEIDEQIAELEKTIKEQEKKRA